VRRFPLNLPGWPSSVGLFHFAGTFLAPRKSGCADKLYSHGLEFMAVIAIVSRIAATSVKATQLLHWLASSASTDKSYLMLLLWVIHVLLFLCAVVVITQHSGWFNA